MRKTLSIGLFGLLAFHLPAAESSLQDTIVGAAKRLGDKTNYSWTTTVKEGDSSTGAFPSLVGKPDESGLIENGTLTKYEFDFQGKVIRGDQQSASNLITTVEIKDVGTTRLGLPAEAKRKLL